MSEAQQQSKKITITLLLSWIFGTLFGLTGIISIFSEPIPGLVMLIMATVLLPPITKLVDKKWKFYLSGGIKIVVVIIGLIIFGATVDTSDVSDTQQTEIYKGEQQITPNKTTAGETNESNQTDIKQPQTKTSGQKDNTTETIPVSTNINQSLAPSKIEDELAPTSNETVSQKNAVAKAKSYLEYSAFSYTGLIEQLEYEQFSHADAVYGVDNSGADWNEQAAKKAQSYMEYSAFSRGSLIEQLEYEGFTQAQAEYGANTVGL